MLDRPVNGANLKEGPERLLDAVGVSVDRMPMLHVIFDKMSALCSENLRRLSASPAFFSVDAIGTRRIGDFLDAYESNVVIGVFNVAAWDSRILIGLDCNFVFALAEALFGGDGGESERLDKRPFSALELRLAQKAFELLGKAMEASFASVCEAALSLERVETRLDFAVVAPRNTFGVVTRMRLRILGRSGEMFVLIPQGALNSIRPHLGRNPSADMAVRDPGWTKQIETEIGRPKSPSGA
ncbi:flagellar motor switch protein FliM [Methylocapsa palsarum]|uniref:Flagellar motor switch protein FliM n=1 Tax=Methylocapsa palsarum TaxID=1612308 RepID=A0A1I3W9S1_9HYPH|nr:flagellar motor switch protein FliM [Methylocapsa palsarum]SFK04424.1 flagellar motor switch protein FliM [Methylocapsa palsarum]